MSSGEADVRSVVEWLKASRSLDAYTRCRAPVGCDVMVSLKGGTEPLCLTHGGPPVPQYETDSEGAIVTGSERHMPANGDCE